MKKTVYTTKIDKGAVVSEIFDDSFNSHAFLQLGEQCISLFCANRLKYNSARNNDVVALLIELDETEFQLLTFEVKVSRTGRTSDQRSRKERTDIVEVDSETAFDLTVDNTGDDVVLLVCSFELHP